MGQVCWIIAGATSAIAMRFAQVVAMQGDQLILLGRDDKKLAAIQADLQIRYAVSVDYLFFDAVKTELHSSIANACIQLAKGPIHLFIAVGLMIPGESIAHSANEAATMINANLTSAVSLSFAFLPHFQAQKQGEILVLGSVAGDRGRPPNFDYGAAKAGLATFCEGLRGALMPDNVSVTLMKLGYIDTPMTYGKKGLFPAASPLACAQACLRAAKKKLAIVYYPSFWQWIMFIFKRLPQFILYRFKV
ncbi:MAG: hypothetical protein A3F13_02290 [Gammaproteobacteria bacterium RIFCSPHIGHO2_12_FULL_40_19]|nr:MAG: hypothetical protein A3F13_02290 [Gammaproteobacteria bacterium RIFCSPHIGHO2_12_FULL_40_19]